MAEQSESKSRELTRRGNEKHKTNPFLPATSDATVTKVKKIANGKGDFYVVAQETGELVGTSGFWHTQDVDKTQFCKLFINGVKALKELTASGTKVFEHLYLEMQKGIGKDVVSMVHADINQTLNPISERTFYRGMRELLDKQFIAETVAPGRYFVNPDFIFNGDRLAIVKEYRLKKTKGHRDDVTPDMFDELIALPDATQEKSTAKRFADMANNYQNEKEKGTLAHLIQPTAGKT